MKRRIAFSQECPSPVHSSDVETDLDADSHLLSSRRFIRRKRILLSLASLSVCLALMCVLVWMWVATTLGPILSEAELELERNSTNLPHLLDCADICSLETIQILGWGCHKDVYLTRHSASGRYYALKVKRWTCAAVWRVGLAQSLLDFLAEMHLLRRYGSRDRRLPELYGVCLSWWRPSFLVEYLPTGTMQKLKNSPYFSSPRDTRHWYTIPAHLRKEMLIQFATSASLFRDLNMMQCDFHLRQFGFRDDMSMAVTDLDSLVEYANGKTLLNEMAPTPLYRPISSCRRDQDCHFCKNADTMMRNSYRDYYEMTRIPHELQCLPYDDEEREMDNGGGGDENGVIRGDSGGVDGEKVEKDGDDSDSTIAIKNKIRRLMQASKEREGFCAGFTPAFDVYRVGYWAARMLANRCISHQRAASQVKKLLQAKKAKAEMQRTEDKGKDEESLSTRKPRDPLGFSCAPVTLLLRRCLAADPQQRASVEELQQLLHHLRIYNTSDVTSLKELMAEAETISVAIVEERGVLQ